MTTKLSVIKYPNLIKMTPKWIHSLANVQVQLKTDRWVPKRPQVAVKLPDRLKAAILVFSGKADALIWPENQ